MLGSQSGWPVSELVLVPDSLVLALSLPLSEPALESLVSLAVSPTSSSVAGSFAHAPRPASKTQVRRGRRVREAIPQYY